MKKEDKGKLLEEYLNGWKRAQADLINYKKGEVKRFEEVVKFSNETLIRELLPVLDSFALAIKTIGADNKKANGSDGLYMIRSQLENVLKKYGLEKLIVSVGQPFDPSIHEAIATTDPPESNQKSGTIAEEVEAGYMLNGKLIRPARVKVIK